MNKKTISKIAISALAPALMLGYAGTLLAEETGARPTMMDLKREGKIVPVAEMREKAGLPEKVRPEMMGDKKAEMMERAQEKGAESIDKRIEDLKELKTKIANMKNVSDTEEAKILASIDEQIAKLTELKTKIGSATDAKVLKEDIASITKNNRVYMNFEPKMKLLAATDRVKTLIEMMNALTPKLDARIDAISTAGGNVVELEKAFTDLTAKIAIATDLASKINTAVSALNPDGGDETVLKANMAVLKEARANLKLANDALKTANKDASIIMKGVRGKGEKKPAIDNRINKGDAPMGTGTSTSNSAQ